MVHLAAHSTPAAEAAEGAYARLVARAGIGPALAAALVLGGSAVLIVARASPGAARGAAALAHLLLLLAAIGAFLRAPAEARSLALRGTFPGARGGFGRGVLVGSGLAVATMAAAWLGGRFAAGPGGQDPGDAWIVVALAIGPTLTPVAEEVVFQGWLQTRLGRLGGGAAAIWATVAFALVHAPQSGWDLARLPALFSFAVIRATNRSLACCIGAHAAYNATLLLAALAAPALGIG